MFYSLQFDNDCPLNYRMASVRLFDDISVVEIGYNRTPKDLCQILKRDVYILHYVTKGCGEFCGKKYTESNGYVVVPNELETIVSDKENPYEAYWIMFKGTKAFEILKNCNLPCHNGIFEFEKTKECSEILHNALFNMEFANEFEEAAIMNSVFYQIIAIHIANMKTPVYIDSVPQKVMRFINENYYNNVTINSISENLGYSRNYLYTLFKNNYGFSPQAYLLNLRIEKAKELLTKEQHLSINEVSRAVGYSDFLYFSRVFHKKVGVSPKEFIKMHK